MIAVRDDVPTTGLRFWPLWLALGSTFVAIVVIGSLMSLPPPVEMFIISDKLLHLGAYAALMLWFAQIFGTSAARALLALGFIALGVGIEYAQGMTPSRQFETLDMLANAAGVLSGWALVHTPAGRVLATLERLSGRVHGAQERTR